MIFCLYPKHNYVMKGAKYSELDDFSAKKCLTRIMLHNLKCCKCYNPRHNTRRAPRRSWSRLTPTTGAPSSPGAGARTCTAGRAASCPRPPRTPSSGRWTPWRRCGCRCGAGACTSPRWSRRPPPVRYSPRPSCCSSECVDRWQH